MTRLRKSRKAKGFIDDSGPSRNERLADPDSYESRRRKALADKKKNKSVFEKQREADNSKGADNSSGQRKTRLADKIRKLNQEKKDD